MNDQFPYIVQIHSNTLYGFCNILRDYFGGSLGWRKADIPYQFISNKTGWYKKGCKSNTLYLENLTNQTASPSWEVNNVITHLCAQTMSSGEPLFQVLFNPPFISITKLGCFQQTTHLVMEGLAGVEWSLCSLVASFLCWKMEDKDRNPSWALLKLNHFMSTNCWKLPSLYTDESFKRQYFAHWVSLLVHHCNFPDWDQ